MQYLVIRYLNTIYNICLNWESTHFLCIYNSHTYLSEEALKMSKLASVVDPRILNVSDILKTSDFEEGTEAYKRLSKVLSDDKGIKNGHDLLEKHKDDLLEDVDEEDAKIIAKIRFELRKADFNKKTAAGIINLDTININTLQWDEACRFLEELFNFKSDKQRRKVYDYMEDNEIGGAYLLTADINDFSTNLDMKDGQKSKLKELFEKIQGRKKGGRNNMTINNYDGNKIGNQMAFADNATVTFGDTYVATSSEPEKNK